MNRLTGKRALITGGTSGIGLETAKQFLAEGARVAVTGATDKTMDTAREVLGKDVLFIKGDAGEVCSQLTIGQTVSDAFGQLDVVFLNAGIAEFRPLADWDEATFDRLMDINFKGPFFLLQALSAYLADPASIILNASINAYVGMPSSSVYAASKAALITLARTLSGEMLGRGVRVNAISPGPISTPLYDKFGLSDFDKRKMAEGIVAQVPVARFGDPIDIAMAAVFLASDESSFCVGSELIVDGGMSTL